MRLALHSSITVKSKSKEIKRPTTKRSNNTANYRASKHQVVSMIYQSF